MPKNYSGPKNYFEPKAYFGPRIINPKHYYGPKKLFWSQKIILGPNIILGPTIIFAHNYFGPENQCWEFVTVVLPMWVFMNLGFMVTQGPLGPLNCSRLISFHVWATAPLVLLFCLYAHGSVSFHTARNHSAHWALVILQISSLSVMELDRKSCTAVVKGELWYTLLNSLHKL